METNYIALAVPAFALLIGVELLVAGARWREYYRLNDSLTNMATGVFQQLIGLVCAGFILGAYAWLHEHARLFDWSSEGRDAVWTWIGCFIAVDFAYYWFHRLSHEVNFLWAAHIAHHQSEEFNLSVALRQGAFQPLFSTVFYWPLALLGFPPAIFYACVAFDTLYQFWVHTRFIDRLGPLEWLFVTPSHHRVHHGRNPIYLDRNHGGCFIVWDRLFGTFQREEEEVAYGITKPLASWNPVWANLHYWIEIARAARRTRRAGDRLQMFLRPPGWHPVDLGGFEPAPPIEQPIRKFDRAHTPATARYATLQFIQGLAIATALPFWQPPDSRLALVAACLWVAWTLGQVGALFDGRPWAHRAEWARLFVSPVLAFATAPVWAGFVMTLLSAIGVGAALLWLPRRQPGAETSGAGATNALHPTPR